MTTEELFNKTVILLGAGASFSADCKLSQGMLKDLEAQITDKNALNDDDLRQAYLEIYDMIVSSLHYQSIIQFGKASVSINIEDFMMILIQIIDRDFVIPYPLVGNWNDKIPRIEIEYGRKNGHSAFERFSKFIQESLTKKWLLHNDIKAARLLKPIKGIIQRNTSLNINIFTLNYDLTFESQFNKKSEQLINDGFSGEVWTGEFNDDSHQVNYFKLHGSLNWYYDSEKEIITKLNDRVVDPLIIFGTANKMMSIEPFMTLLQHFKKKLETSTLIIVIGYSFHDKYLNNMIIQSIMSAEKKLLIVDPCLNNTTSQDFVKKLSVVQQAKSIYERVNFSILNPERVKILPISAQTFYKRYFENDAANLKEMLKEIESENEIF